MSIAIKHELLAWYQTNKRLLPWRETSDPYRIWISEVILQQTRVAQGEGYYHRFLKQFPDVASLAAASQDQVMYCWQGLGYYTRARNLHAAAKQIVDEFEGVFPVHYNDVRRLKGVGNYTAAAICSIAYNAPYAVVDGNVYRILARLFAESTPIDTLSGKRLFATLADSLLDRRSPGAYNQAIMDFGAMQCTPLSPDCVACPLHEQCVAYKTETVCDFPVKNKQNKTKDRYFNYLHIHSQGKTLLRRRTQRDIWNGLYEFPLIETPNSIEFDLLIRLPLFRSWADKIETIRLVRTIQMPKHQLTHQTIHAKFYEMQWSDMPSDDTLLAIVDQQLHLYPVSRLMQLYLEKECLFTK